MLTTIKNISFSIIVILVFFMLIEVGFYFSGYDGNSYDAILFGEDPNSPLLFEKSPLLWWRLKKNADIEFLGKRVVTDSLGLRCAPSTISGSNDPEVSILFLGDSSTFGWRMNYEQTFPYLLQKMLTKNLSKDVRIIIGGIPGYSSFQSLLLFKEISRKINPDIVVIYLSNNELSMADNSDCERFKMSESFLWLKTVLNLSSLYQFMQNQINKPISFYTSKPITLEQLYNMPTRVSLEEYRQNILEIMGLSYNNMATPVLLTVPSNLEFLSMLDIPDRNSEVNELLAGADQLIMQKKYDSALKNIETAQRISPEYYKCFYLKGIISKLRGTGDEMGFFEKAIECHLFPARLKKSYNDAILDLAEKNNTLCVDLYGSLKSGSYDLDKLFIDACHPSIDGHELLAKMLYAPIAGVAKKMGRASTGSRS